MIKYVLNPEEKCIGIRQVISLYANMHYARQKSS